MNLLQDLIEAFLIEAAALTKGSQRVMNDKNLVAGLADAVRDDARSHPQNFPSGFSRTAQKTPDPELAQWFLENIDKIEKEGYEGTVYSRDGVNSEWIVRRYIAGSHNWEDLTGVMNMNLRDWYLLKNRNMLDANHKDIQKFNSVRDIGYYMTTHYKDQLEKVRDAAKNAARNKMAKSVKLVDNDDYRIYTTLNRAASCALGLGTQWCTANSNYSGHYHTYSNRAMLFQMFPYAKEKDAEGDKVIDNNQKYQFDAGGPHFMDATDKPVPAKVIHERFPYLYSDLTHALKTNKNKIETAIKELDADPTLQGEDFKVKKYDISKEIEKLHTFVDKGYMTDEARPKAVSSKDDSGQEQPQISPPTEQPQQQAAQEQPPMESIRELAKRMLEGRDLDQEELEEDDVEEDDELGDAGIAPPSQTGGAGLGSMGGGAGPTGGGGQYPPGTAPTMPESLNHKGNEIMENVDKDVAAMLASLKKYDVLKESCAPVLMARPKPFVAEEEDKKEGNPWEKLASDKKDDEKTSKTHKGGTVTKTEKGLVHKAADKKDKVDEKKEVEEDDKEKVEEGADQEVLTWMKRFASLGNMKGYGR